jgi:magnesium-transporting ATPase (P-type)
MQYKRVYDKPFDSEDRQMVAGFERGDQRLYFAKGDPEVIVKMCAGYMTASGDLRKVDGFFLGSIKSVTDLVNQQGDIAIALAYSPGTTIPPRVTRSSA